MIVSPMVTRAAPSASLASFPVSMVRSRSPTWAVRDLWFWLIVLRWVTAEHGPERGNSWDGEGNLDPARVASEDTAKAREPAWCHLLSSGWRWGFPLGGDLGGSGFR